MFRFKNIKIAIIGILFISPWFLVAFPVSAGLVPCEGLDCTLCDLFVLIKNIIDFLVKASFALAGLMIAFGGIMFLVAGGNPANIQRAKGIITAGLIGIIIVLVSWTLIDTILVMIAGSAQPTGSPWPWNDIICTI